MKKLICVLSFGLFGLTMFTGEYTSTASAQHYVHKKKWSKRKKNAVIGGAAGAATGAIVSHHKGRGALIGGAVGAGAGYLYGRHKDKKAGRLPGH
jgi:hypothetical protein